MSSSALLRSTHPSPDTEPSPHLRLVTNNEQGPGTLPPATQATLPATQSWPGEEDAREPRRDVLAKLAVYAFEAVHGTRGISQLAHWVTGEVTETLYRRRALHVERRSFYHDLRRTTPRAGPVHLSRPCPRIADAVIIVHTGLRASAVTMRLRHENKKWRATELTVL